MVLQAQRGRTSVEPTPMLSKFLDGEATSISRGYVAQPKNVSGRANVPALSTRLHVVMFVDVW